MAEQQEQKQNFWQRLKVGGDKPLWIIYVVFAFVSLFVVYSSTTSSLYGVTTSGHHISRFIKQFAYLIVGLATVWGMHRLNCETYQRAAKAAYLVSLIFMVLVMFVGVDKFGAQRWLRIPIVGITFQPSDFLKVTTVVMLALQLARRQRIIEKVSLLPTLHQIKYDPLKAREILRSHSLPVFGTILLSCGFIVPENMSTALLMGATCVIMLIIGRVKWADIGRFIAIAAVFGSIVIGCMMITKSFTGGDNRTGTWGKRIVAFVCPDKVGDDYLYQPRQAKIAIAMGKFWGLGVGNSAQRHMLPKSESDYAFAFLVEEWGMAGAVLVVLLYLWIFYRSIVIFNSCGTAFPCLLVLGLAFLVAFQGLLHMMVSTGLMFQTGLVLPLISQGGSAELFTSMAIGMILGVSRQVEEHSLSTPKSESMLEVNRKK